MTEQVNEPVTEPAEGANPEATDIGDKGKAAIKAIREEREAAEQKAKDEATRASQLETELATLRASGETETQRYTDELNRVQKELESATRAKNIAQIAATKSVPLDILAGPDGTDPEALDAYAEKLLAFRGETKPSTQRTVVENEGQGKPLALNGEGIELALRSALGIV